MNSHLISVVTTIQGPTDCMQTLSGSLHAAQAPLIIVGDKKGPDSYDLQGAELLDFQSQLQLPFHLVKDLPTGHYVRKNLGYLLAFSRGAQCIYETDDDNAPNASWAPRQMTTSARTVDTSSWFNVYRLFSDELIWPRGLPLDRIRAAVDTKHDDEATEESVEAPIQQGLANRSPDVDAVWRLVLDKEFYFHDAPSVRLAPGTWCPFNSQSTWWWPVAYPLMYLPSYCTFRMTDIWRGFVAQRCLWAMGKGLVFHAPEVDQERNVHNLVRDFEHEIPGYLKNDEFVGLLEKAELHSDPPRAGENLLLCYESLVQAGIFPEKELSLVKAWLADVNQTQPSSD